MSVVINDATCEDWEFNDADILADFLRFNGFHVDYCEDSEGIDVTHNHTFTYQTIHVY